MLNTLLKIKVMSRLMPPCLRGARQSFTHIEAVLSAKAAAVLSLDYCAHMLRIVLPVLSQL